MRLDNVAFLGIPLPTSIATHKQAQCSKRPKVVKTSSIHTRRAKSVNIAHVRVEINAASNVRCSASSWESLTQESFDQKLASNSLQLCLVGMSNCGKSHWSTQLCTHKSFHLICVDDQIEQEISPELEQLGYSGIDGMAKWMGFPSDQRFAENQHRYLVHEERITSRAAPNSRRSTVLDTTGSVVYLSDKTLDQLRADYLVIHLEANDAMLEMMTDNYFKTPKPVVWGDAFNRQEHETPMQAMRRCYPGLLTQRRELYTKLAHIAVPAAFSLSREVNVEDFLEYVREQLR